MMRGRVSSGCGDVSPREMLEQERFEYAPLVNVPRSSCAQLPKGDCVGRMTIDPKVSRDDK